LKVDVVSDIDLDHMRRAGHILSKTLEFLTDGFIEPGMCTLDISNKAEEIIRSYEGSTPAFLGYHGFPGAVCVSVNNQVVHGIPTKELIISAGDIVSIDGGVIYEGHFSDACRTVGVGEIGPRLKKLLKVTEESLLRGIEQVIIGNRIGDISYAVQKHVERNRFNVSLEFVGHGIGKVLHGPPCVPNYGPPKRGEEIKLGTCLAIEPVVFDGPADAILADDGWTVLSKHDNMSAHFEDTVIATEEGPEIVTR
jgi:methionyl aminopeptidase